MRLLHIGALCAAGLVVCGSHTVFAQTADDWASLKAEIQALRKGQETVKQELAEIRKLLEGRQSERPAAFHPVVMSLDGASAKGSPDATVTLVEFTDYQCPFCQRHFAQTMPQIMTDYVETGKVRYIVREYPLKQIHSRAARAAEAALCAGEQNKYWEMHAQMFRNQRELGDQDLVAHAKAVDLDVTAFQSCLEEGRFGQRVAADLNEATKAGVQVTPSFVLGLTDPDNPGQFTATEYLRGAIPFVKFQQVIDKLLAADPEQTDEGEE